MVDIGRHHEGKLAQGGKRSNVLNGASFVEEVETSLLSHPAVRLAAAVGKPDAVRTEIVKAYIVLAEGFAPSDALAAEIRDWVKRRLSMHEYPREIAFIDDLPMTTTGKVVRRLLRERAAAELAGEFQPAEQAVAC